MGNMKNNFHDNEYKSSLAKPRSRTKYSKSTINGETEWSQIDIIRRIQASKHRH
ncbi:YpzG family protein [Bacillus fonticola]|uniref:YpzG family protein n=1 Tax=Bacillus fonticola TaxID=2728853 RepID=UPI001475B770|nr:YpzG family protein [Bacillus fonticola]